MTETRKIDEIKWRQDLYPRFEPDPTRIQQYAENVERLPPIEINQHNEIIDGYHRWTAHKKSEQDIIEVFVTHTKDDVELDRLSCRRNASFGIQLTGPEKKAKANLWYTGLDTDKQAIADDLSVTLQTVNGWVADRAKELRKQQSRIIKQMWLACYSQNEIAEAIGQDQSTVATKTKNLLDLKNFSNLINFAKYQDDNWSPPLYNVWTYASKSNKTSIFGNTEQTILDNLLYLYTEPFDIVVDLFAGAGSTIDVCKKRLRRYWTSDRLLVPERLEIRQHDVADGAPSHLRWSDVTLVYLDPPYWKQAENEYSQDAADLANMSLEDFYSSLVNLVRDCARRMTQGHIALIIQPTQWNAPDRKVVDHVIDIIAGLAKYKKLSYKYRISCPYSTQQYNPQQTTWAKENKEPLLLTRELIIWSIE